MQSNISDELKIKLEKMKKFVPMILKPDGNIVQVGDSGTHSLIGFDALLKELKDSPRTLLSETNSNSLVQKYICEGYGSIRNFSEDRANFEKSFYLFFNAGAHKERGHRQSDDLSFVVSNMGHEVLFDPGFYSYRNDRGREYVTSVHAHNTLSINGNNYNSYKTTFNYVVENYEKGYVVFSGSHENFVEAEYKRLIIWIENNLLIIIDHVVPYEFLDDEKRFIKHVDQYFHFAPELKITQHDKINNGTILVHSDKGELIAQISQLMKSGIEIFQVAGQKEPMQGWHSAAHSELMPAPTLITRFDGKEPLITSIFFPDQIIGKKEIKAPEVKMEKNKSVYSLKINHLSKNLIFQFDAISNDLINISSKQICL